MKMIGSKIVIFSIFFFIMIEDAYGERVVGGFRRKPSRDQQQSSDDTETNDTDAPNSKFQDYPDIEKEFEDKCPEIKADLNYVCKNSDDFEKCQRCFRRTAKLGCFETDFHPDCKLLADCVAKLDFECPTE